MRKREPCACARCGNVRKHVALGLCGSCYHGQWRTKHVERHYRLKAESRQRWRVLREQHPDKVALQRLRWKLRRHGLTVEQFRAMRQHQGSCCAICDVYSGNLVIDHNHKTGVVRRLLCNGCNTAIGLMREDPMLMSVAAAYVKDSVRVQ